MPFSWLTTERGAEGGPGGGGQVRGHTGSAVSEVSPVCVCVLAPEDQGVLWGTILRVQAA